MTELRSLCGKSPCTCLCERWKWCEAGKARQRFLAGKYRLGILEACYTLDADNKARIARYQRENGVVVNTATGEIVEPTFPSLAERALDLTFGPRVSKPRTTFIDNWGRRHWKMSGVELPREQIRGKGKHILAIVALIALALGILFYPLKTPDPVLPEGSTITYETRRNEYGYSERVKVYDIPGYENYFDFQTDWIEAHRDDWCLLAQWLK
jgi:hypothetical protein